MTHFTLKRSRESRRARAGVGLLAIARMLGRTPRQMKLDEQMPEYNPETDGPETFVALLERVYVALDDLVSAAEALRARS